MEEEVYLTILYDYYGALLTEKQRLYFTYYYFDNLSLQEIKENLDVSRNAIHKELKIIKDKFGEIKAYKFKGMEKSESMSKESIIENTKLAFASKIRSFLD